MNNSDLAAMRRSRYGVSVSVPSIDQSFSELQSSTKTAITERMVPLGFIDGAYHLSHGHKASDEAIRFVSPGETVPISAGQTVLVQDTQGDKEWVRYLFPDGGQLRGPMVYAVDTPSAGEIEGALLTPSEGDRQQIEKKLTGVFVAVPCYLGVVIMSKLQPDLPGGLLSHILTGIPIGAILSGVFLALLPGIMRLRDRSVFHREIECLRQLGLNGTVPVELPDEAWRQCSQSELLVTPRGKVEAPKPDLEISTALGRVRQSEHRVGTLPSPVGSLKRSVVRHSVGIIEDISKRAQRGGHLKEGSALKTAIREAIAKAESEMKRLEAEGHDREQDALMRELKTLRGQMDTYLGTRDPA
jgi:hypothetical protein